jgi:quercetin dioxygenase-like cupin family protein
MLTPHHKESYREEDRVAAACRRLTAIVRRDGGGDDCLAGTENNEIFDGELPNVPGKSMRAVLVEYGPGAASPSHRHPSSAFIYATVLEGEIRSKVNDAPEHVYKAGESWTEVPGDHHTVSANASSTKPARLLAIFVVDTAEKEILIPDK